MRKYLTAATLIVLTLGLVVAVVACGGGSVAGTYKIDDTDQALLQDVRMVLDDDGGFKISGPDADNGETMTFTGTYTVDGDSITLQAKGVDETEKGTIQGGKLVFKDVTWTLE